MKHIVIFSHGFGTRKDDRGLFPDIIVGLNGLESLMFDYNVINGNAITVNPLSKQAEILKETIDNVRQSNPDSIIDLVCHSQGCVVAALLNPFGIRKTVFVAPTLGFDVNRTIERFQGREGTEINLDGLSKFVRADGSITFIPANYWKELETINPIDLYGKFSASTGLAVIIANQDEIIKNPDVSVLNGKAEIIKLDGDHDFSGIYRKPLVGAIKDILA